MSDTRHNPDGEKRDRGTRHPGALQHSGHSWHFQPCLILPCAWSSHWSMRLMSFPVFLSSTPSSFLIHSNSFMKAFSCPGCSRRQQGPLCPLSEQWGLSSCTVTRPGGLSQAGTEISSAHLSSPHSIQSWCVSVCTHEN